MRIKKKCLLASALLVLVEIAWLSVMKSTPLKVSLDEGMISTRYEDDRYFLGFLSQLPHLKKNILWRPRLNISAGRTNVSLVFGVPTIPRPVKSYLQETIQSLIDNMSVEEAKDCLIVISLNDPWNATYEDDTINTLRIRFARQFEEGLLEVISPFAEFYPDLTQLELTLGDSKDRVYWRSKQNLDYVFLMTHASSRGKYYIQLEDDLITKPGYIRSIHTTIHEQTDDWIVIYLSKIGFIGRLFKQETVPRIINFLLLFYSRKPCDWLLADFMLTEICGRPPCPDEIKKRTKYSNASLFQHLGLYSSLKGKVSKIKISVQIEENAYNRNKMRRWNTSTSLLLADSRSWLIED